MKKKSLFPILVLGTQILLISCGEKDRTYCDWLNAESKNSWPAVANDQSDSATYLEPYADFNSPLSLAPEIETLFVKGKK